ncbi:MAG: LysE family translocator [bacterium]|nr:LysE family translocator [bacterium]
MPDFAAGLSLVLLTNALGMFSPGPDMFLLIRNSTGTSPGVAYATVFGISTGIALHVVLSLAGVTGLALQNPTIFRGFLVLAGLYLLYIGLPGLRIRNRKGVGPGDGSAPPNPDAADPVLATGSESGALRDSTPARKTVFAAYREGLLCNVLNLKAAAFFVSLFGLMIGPDTAAAQRIALGLICVIQCVALWSLFVWLLRKGFARGGKVVGQVWIAKGFSALLVFAGGVLLYQAFAG